jgi:hypothetical protein
MANSDPSPTPTDTANYDIRGRLARALAGEPVEWPVYLVYDYFVQHRRLDWPALFAQGLGELRHADLVHVERPNVEIVDTTTSIDGQTRRDRRWITDRGELHEWWLGPWRKEHPIKRPEDYAVMARAWEGTRYTPTDEFFLRAEADLGNRGLTVGHLGWEPLRRLPLMELHVELAGPERIAYDLADECRPLLDLLDQLGEVMVDKCRAACQTSAQYIKLWENFSVEMVGPTAYRAHMVPLYRRILDVFGEADRRVLVHYDGRLRPVADDVGRLGFDGIDSFSGPPEGDTTPAEARRHWPNMFLWMHPSLEWFRSDPEAATLEENVLRMAREAGPSRFCFQISEEVPPDPMRTIPRVLRALADSYTLAQYGNSTPP